MPIPKSLLAGGVAATLAIGGGAVIAHEFIDNPSSAVGSQTTASTRTISADLNARQIYDASKNAAPSHERHTVFCERSTGISRAPSALPWQLRPAIR